MSRLRKTELYRLVEKYRGMGATTSQIAVALGITERWCLTILVDLGLHQPRVFSSPSHFIEHLSRVKTDREELAQFRNGTNELAESCVSA